jgi:hypothetical protein
VSSTPSSWDGTKRRPSKYRKCPNCGEDLQYDEVDIGVGFMSSPACCPDPECGYGENTSGLVEPDGRVATGDVPQERDLASTWAEVPLPPTPNERQLEDELHDAINPPGPHLNTGLARIGAQKQVERIMEVLRQRGLING